MKAGKSTFINALIGERILPTDILQSSRAVVEIFKSDRKHVKICFADGHSETVHDDPSTPDLDEAFERSATDRDDQGSIPQHPDYTDRCWDRQREHQAGPPITH